METKRQEGSTPALVPQAVETCPRPLTSSYLFPPPWGDVDWIPSSFIFERERLLADTDPSLINPNRISSRGFCRSMPGSRKPILTTFLAILGKRWVNQCKRFLKISAAYNENRTDRGGWVDSRSSIYTWYLKTARRCSGSRRCCSWTPNP